MLYLAGVIAVIGMLLKFSHIPLYVIVLLGSLLYLVTGGWRWIWLLSKTFKRDVYLIKVFIVIAYGLIKLKITKTKLLSDMLSKCVKKHPDKLAFVSADTNASLTFKETENLCHKIANIFYEAGYRKGDVVALLMENRIEYMPIWLGLSMIGVITSLLNFNLRGTSLKHCIDVSNCKGIIFSAEMIGSLKEIENDLTVETYCYDKCDGVIKSCKYLESLMESTTYLPPPRSQDLNIKDVLLYMYTSGTTGLPKAVVFRGSKNMFGALFFSACVVTDGDILYQALPLYHGNGMSFTSTFFFTGCTTIIKKKFSASKYIEDCCKYNVTAINYIGETCRYLLSQPKSVFDQMNRIRLAMGNGLKASIWTEFKERFKIKTIFEFYGSTEGNTVLMPNMGGRVGAVGFKPVLFSNRDLMLVKMNKETGLLQLNVFVNRT